MNNLSKLRKEFKYTQTDLANILETSTTNVGFYEQEKRDFSTKLLTRLSNYFQVSIDYILGAEDGIYVYFDGNQILKFNVSEILLIKLINQGVIYYKEDSYKRYINVNKLLGVPSSNNLSNMMESIKTIDELLNIFPTLPLTNKDDLDRFYCISKMKSLDDNKIHILKKLLELL